MWRKIISNRLKIVNVDDKMQTAYQYELIEPIGENFAIDFLPELSPEQMLTLGIFEGKYLNDCRKEFPNSWFLNAKISEISDPSLNYFGIKARQSLATWQNNGWIIYPDVRGWFQWYCRYFMGRRINDIDKIQIKRWKMFYRHKAQILKHCIPGDYSCRKKQRQALLQWAYNPFF